MKITVNAVEKEICDSKTQYNYDELCELAGQKPSGQTVVYSYRKGDFKQSGSITKGNALELYEGMHVSVMHTNNA